MTGQLEQRKGQFGASNTDRNRIDWNVRTAVFRTMLGGRSVRRVLEVGCNRGHNLVALREILSTEAEILGIEPSPYALEIAKTATQGSANVCAGDALNLPFLDGSFDLVLTADVLIHIAAQDLLAALNQIHRVSRRYTLAVEYFASEETVVPYCDDEDLLWKPDFLKHYLTLFPRLALLQSGFWDAQEGFDNSHWWLLQNSGSETDAQAVMGGLEV